MNELETRKFAGIDLSKYSVQFSIYDESLEEMTEESFPLQLQKEEDYIAKGMKKIAAYMMERQLDWNEYTAVRFTMEDAGTENRKRLTKWLDAAFKERHGVKIITRFRAFVEYVFHQERVVWDHNTLLLDYSDNRLQYIRVEQIHRAKQRAYRAEIRELDLKSYEIVPGAVDQDLNFSRMIKQFFIKNQANIVFLTGAGFEGNWMKRTLTYLCSGRRVFLGQNLYANGACLLGIHTISLMDEGMLLMQGKDMVYHTIGIITSEAGKVQYVPITSIGKEWYNTWGTMDIILDKSQKVEFFYHNTKENEMECVVCEVKDLPKRPPKTTRIRIQVQFVAETEGVILLKDMGFGTMYPATGKVTVFPFALIS